MEEKQKPRQKKESKKSKILILFSYGRLPCPLIYSVNDAYQGRMVISLHKS
tara:strand:- start:32 stop:184 length:153 start_codon:yes stop_codon:yes gene_type:complete